MNPQTVSQAILLWKILITLGTLECFISFGNYHFSWYYNHLSEFTLWILNPPLVTKVTWLVCCFSLCVLSNTQWRHELVDEIFIASMLYVMKFDTDTPWTDWTPVFCFASFVAFVYFFLFTTKKVSAKGQWRCQTLAYIRQVVWDRWDYFWKIIIHSRTMNTMTAKGCCSPCITKMVAKFQAPKAKLQEN